MRTPPASPVDDGGRGPTGEAQAPTTPPGPLSVAAGLAGSRILVTGATGFLGTAVVERLLRSVPDCEVVVLVRPGRRLSAAQRTAREIIRNDCFDRLRAEWGDDFADRVQRRLVSVSGDVSQDGLGLDDEGRRVLASCDIVVHSAATVSFDAPLDTAVEVNLLGPSRVAAAIGTVAGTRTDTYPGRARTHLITVSTAYVAGTHQGQATETLFTEAVSSGARARTHTTVTTDVDIAAEIESARRLRDDLESESRRPGPLARFTKAARGELGAAGTHVLAERAEKLRDDWVRKQLVDAGRARAQALGWPDAYAFTKALGERALVASHADTPITVVRPSIIESALAEPRPGWIRGFRMAEPIIISYARGLLKEFPGVPEGIVDVVPVDMVVAAIVAVAAAGPDPAGASVYQVASSVRNPLRYGELVDLVQSWFTEHPLYDADGQPIVVPEWSFPGRGRVQRQLRRATTAFAVAERLLAVLPVRGERADLAARFEDQHTRAERALGYVELYGAYTETEAHFRVDRLLALWERLAPAEREVFCFDPAVIRWPHYVHDVHLPSVVDHARVRSTPAKSTMVSRTERSQSAILSPERHLAAFDLENTLIASNVVESYAWLASRHLPAGERVTFTARLLREAPGLLALDRRDRGDFLRSFYRRYDGASAQMLRDDSWELFHQMLLTKSFPAGFARVRAHRALGHRTVLITGALDFVVEPLRPLFDEVVCASLGVDATGRFTGRLDSRPPTGEARALVLAQYAADSGLDLGQSVAYADSTSDLPLLECVGFPVAVNPEARLAAVARRRGWHVEHWDKAGGGGGRPVLPMGPLDHGVSRWWARLEGALDNLSAGSGSARGADR
ncbi:MAG TPA: HAD-IB family phosphatase [Acidimicrobiales bacterium]|nr:HAD-IB family phosphatase [Acidimicrobiales bacterium]